MPIFTRGNERVYFAHIPKTAGSAIYILFLRNGWSLSNVESGLGSRRIGRRIYDEFGIKDIPLEGDRGDFTSNLQHATADIWSRWEPFTSSFAVVRNPVTRFESAMKYQYSRHKREKTLSEYRDAQIRRIKRKTPDQIGTINVHFRAQVDFILPDTRIFRFESAFVTELARAYKMDVSEIEKINAAPETIETVLTPDVKGWIGRYYAKDFARFGYDI